MGNLRHSPLFIQHTAERGPGLRYVEKLPTGSSPGDGTHLRCPGREAERCCPCDCCCCCRRRACGCPEPLRPADRAVARATPGFAITTLGASCTELFPPSCKPRSESITSASCAAPQAHWLGHPHQLWARCYRTCSGEAGWELRSGAGQMPAA